MSSNVLTPEEEEVIREQSKRCSLDTKQLLAIIHRLVKLLVEPATSSDLRFMPLFSDRAESEIRRIAREVAREEIQKYKEDEEVPF